MRQRLKKITPPPLRHLGSTAYYWYLNRGRHNLARALRPLWAANRRKLLPYRSCHSGERCFIIGNGPSLRRTDLSLLQSEATFGLNRVYLLFPELGFTTTYLVSVNELVLEQCVDEFKRVDVPKFITWRARRWFADDPRTIFLDTDYTGPEAFSGEAGGRLFEGFTVTFVALQLAFYMGFSEVILIGVDHHFESRGQPNSVVTSSGGDPNHFSPDYFGKGFRWQLPDLEGSERAYRMAKAAYESSGRRVLDATVDGKLAVFPKADYSSLFPHV
jgi:hypothetical protein